MNYITHSMGGAAAGLMILSAGNITDPVKQTAVMAGAVLGSLFIDIDHRQSWAGHKFPLVAEVVASLFKHRGIVHTPVFIFAISALLALINWSWLKDLNYLGTYFVSGFVPGMFSHIVLDTLNVQGIMWLWPITDKRFHLLPIRTGSVGEAVVCMVLAVCLFGQFKLWG